MFAIALLCFTMSLSFSLASDPACTSGLWVRPEEVKYIESLNYPNNAPPGFNCAWYVGCPPRGPCLFECDDVQLAESDRLVLSTEGEYDPNIFHNKIINTKYFTAKSDNSRFSIGFVTSPSSTGSRFKCKVRPVFVPEDNIGV